MTLHFFQIFLSALPHQVDFRFFGYSFVLPVKVVSWFAFYRTCAFDIFENHCFAMSFLWPWCPLHPRIASPLLQGAACTSIEFTSWGEKGGVGGQPSLPRGPLSTLVYKTRNIRLLWTNMNSKNWKIGMNELLYTFAYYQVKECQELQIGQQIGTQSFKI